MVRHFRAQPCNPIAHKKSNRQTGLDHVFRVKILQRLQNLLTLIQFDDLNFPNYKMLMRHSMKNNVLETRDEDEHTVKIDVFLSA